MSDREKISNAELITRARRSQSPAQMAHHLGMLADALETVTAERDELQAELEKAHQMELYEIKRREAAEAERDALRQVAEAAENLELQIAGPPDMTIPGKFRGEQEAIKSRHYLQRALKNLQRLNPCQRP